MGGSPGRGLVTAEAVDLVMAEAVGPEDGRAVDVITASAVDPKAVRATRPATQKTQGLAT
jgi:hypothetical protein